MHTHTEVCSCWQCSFIKCQMSKESLIILSNNLLHVFTKLKQYEQLPENYNSSFKMYCGFSV